jgi:hypothetical protein
MITIFPIPKWITTGSSNTYHLHETWEALMGKVWKRQGMPTEFWCVNLSEYPEEDEGTILKCTLGG